MFPLRHKRHNSVMFVLMIMVMIVMSLVGTRLCEYDYVCDYVYVIVET